MATERVHDRLVQLGYETGLKRDVLGEAAALARGMRTETDNV